MKARGIWRKDVDDDHTDTSKLTKSTVTAASYKSTSSAFINILDDYEQHSYLLRLLPLHLLMFEGEKKKLL